MRCSRCHRPLKSPAVVSGGQTLGPTCAKRLGVPTGRARRARTQEQAGQLPLFEVVGGESA